MKFGETLQERSVSKWAAYNFNYNEIKHLIKRRTTKGIAEPLPIPGQSRKRWAELEDELFQILKGQHDNIALFLRSKYGEIDRRLAHLEKQLRSAQRAVEVPDPRSVLRARRYHKLLQEAESIGEDIQALSRFAAVQKVAFRKILKKYRKWTHSTDLQTILEQELFSAGSLDLDFAQQLDRLSKQTKIITQELQGPLLRGESSSNVNGRLNSPVSPESPVTQLREAAAKSSLSFDATFATLPFGVAAGLASYWIHPDNLEEARVLLLRHMQEMSGSASLSNTNSVASIVSHDHSSHLASVGDTHVVYFDNMQRFAQDQSTYRPSRIALSGRWNSGSEAFVAMLNLPSRGLHADILAVKRKDLAGSLVRSNFSSFKRRQSVNPSEMKQIQDYLLEHRDVKPLAEMHSLRSRFSSLSNSSKVGTWATLDTDIVVAAFNEQNVGTGDIKVGNGEAFPHAVLEVRWEFGRTPEVVRAFDASHLAERIRDFSLESVAVYTTNNKDLEAPLWKAVLEEDIRKVPISTRVSAARKRNSNQIRTAGISSGTSSTDGPTDSVFSATVANSSNTSEDSPSISVQDGPSVSEFKPSGPAAEPTKKSARIHAESPSSRPMRYWNEFDDGDSDTHVEDAYTIYIDPDERFPGVETFSKAIGAAFQSIDRIRDRFRSWLPNHDKSSTTIPSSERSPLLLNTSIVPEVDSSDSDTTPTSDEPSVKKKRKQSVPVAWPTSTYGRTQVQLSPRRKALEKTYYQTYVGLFVLSYVLLFMSAVLLSTGRRKARLQVDSGVIIGSVMAETCAAVALILVWMRRTDLGVVHWGVVSVAAVGVLILGVALVAGVAGM